MDDKQLLYLFADLVRSYTAYADKSLVPFNIRFGQGGIISALGRNGPMSQNELANIRQVTPATISVMLGRMERDGLVNRNNNRGGRINLISLTEKGQDLFVRLDAHMNNEPNVLLRGLTDEEKAMAEVIFEKIRYNSIHPVE